KAQRWSLDWPESRPNFHEVPLPETIRAMLRYNVGRSAAWSDSSGHQWAMFFLRWEPGRASAQLAKAHGPDICLPASGTILRQDLGPRMVRVHGLDLPGHAYLFDYHDRPLYVFF